MTAFGGAIKLTGESEYRQALQKCTQNLQTMSSALKAQTIDFNNSDKSMKNNVAKQKELTDSIKQEQEALNKAKSMYAQYSVAVQTQTTRHNALNKEYKNAVLELDRIKAATGESSSEYKKQADVVNKLGQELADSTENLNESKSAMASLKSEINSSNKIINNAQRELNDLGNEAEDTGEQAKKAGDGFTVFKGILADLGSKAIQTAISGLKKLGGALIDVGKQSINQYARYEQLVGGVETLFKDSADIVQQYAANAFKTAGLSANDYMDQITSFSASLLQSLGQDTKKAAEYGNLAIIDMSDNANKMGTSIGMIQNAYQGFAKQNYTMLDNLKLGYGGTKTEMERLIKDANAVKKANGEMADLSISKFADVVEAIHIIQTEMGITGTTSKEAASTIEGSTGSMSAAWDNLLVAIADDNQDISKAVDDFVNTVVTSGKNLVPRIKTVVNGIKKLINSIVTEVFPKLKKEIPELAPLIDTFQWFIDNKSLVVNAIKLMITAFAVNKVMKFTKSLTDTAKKILDLANGTKLATTATTENTVAEVANTTAKTAGATATGLLTKAQNLLNAAWKANPIGLIVGGVTALVGLFSVLTGGTNKVTEEFKRQKEVLDEDTKAWNDLKESQQKQLDAGMSELSYYDGLYKELTEIVDANGKVKDGYEARANFIVTRLNEALGTEIKMTDGVVKGYGNLAKSIQEVMDKKRAEIILSSQESLWKEAMENETDATQKLIEWKDKLNEAQERVDKAKENSIINGANYNTVELIVAQKHLEQVQSSYNQQEQIVREYAYNKALYEQNMALAQEGAYDQMKTSGWNYIKDLQGQDEAQKVELQGRIETTQTHLEELKALKEQYDTDMFDSQIRADEEQLKQLNSYLAQYNSSTKKGLTDVNIKWSDGLDDMLSTITGKKVEFQEDGKGNVQAYIDGVAAGKPMTTSEMATLVSDVVKEITKKNADANAAGQYLLDGVNSGIGNAKKQKGVFGTMATFGGNLLSTLERKLGINSPSKKTKQMGQYLLQGLDIGIDNEENKTLRKVSNVGQDVINALQDELNQNVSLGNITVPSVKSNSAMDSYYNPLINSFKEALKDMKIELDDYEVGKFVDKTVTNAVFN